MGYSDTKTYTLDAATTALSDVMAALIAHFTTAPGRWELVPGAPPVAGESLAIRAKADSISHIAIRRVGTTQLGAVLDPDSSIDSAGDASTEPTGSANMSPECRSGGSFPSISTRFFVCEYDSAIAVLFQDPGKSLLPSGIMVGKLFNPMEDGDELRGIDGHAVLVGAPASSVTNCWFNTTTQTNGSRIRGLDEGGVAQWYQAFASFPSTGMSTSVDGTLRPTRGIMMSAANINSSIDLDLGPSIWFKTAPQGASPSFPGKNPLDLLIDPIDQSWLYVRNAVSTTFFIVNWERGVVPT